MAPTPAITATVTNCARHRVPAGARSGRGRRRPTTQKMANKDERPHQVELLLDGERPGVLER